MSSAPGAVSTMFGVVMNTIRATARTQASHHRSDPAKRDRRPSINATRKSPENGATHQRPIRPLFAGTYQKANPAQSVVAKVPVQIF
jgi:hypothetical protein